MAKKLVGISEFSRQIAYGDMPDPYQPKEPRRDYKDPGNMRVAEAWLADLRNRRAAVRQRMKLLDRRWQGGHGSLMKSDYDHEQGIVRKLMSRIGMYLKWVKDWIKGQHEALPRAA